MSDYANALAASRTFDDQLQSIASQISASYADLVLLSVVQTFGSLDITVGTDSHGDLNADDIKIYMNNFNAMNGLAT